MEKELLKLGLNEKEIKVYLALLEFGNQPASIIAKKVKLPKSTVLFLFENLIKKNYIKKSQKGRIQYFYADPKDLEIAKKANFKEELETLDKVIPLLQEFKNPFSSLPKLTFFEGISGCKQAYSMLLESETEILEIATHDDLAEKFGDDFMNQFIAKRSEKNIFLKAICKKNSTHKKLAKDNKKHCREIHFYPEIFGNIYSSIAIFENKVLLLNLYQDAFAILIENMEFAETLRTIHRISWQATEK